MMHHEESLSGISQPVEKEIKPRARKFLLPCLGLLLALVLAGGAPEQARAAADATPPAGDTICIGGAPGIPPLLTHEQGLFAAEGLTIHLKKYRTASEGFEGFFRGECDLAAVSETSVVLKSFDHQDFSILATFTTSDNSPRILASRQSGITTPRDLKGKRIFVLKWSSNHFFLDMFLAKNGMSEQDVTVVLSGVPDVAAAFANGSIDAFCATEVLIDKPQRALGNEAVVFDAPGLCLVSFQLAAKNSLIRTRPDLVRKVLSALLRNEEGIKKDHAAAVKTAAAALGLEEQVMHNIWGNYRWDVELSQALLLSLEQEARWAMDSGFTNKTKMPNYLDYVYRDALLGLRPAAVTMLK